MFLPRSLVKIQYCGEPPWPRGSVLGLGPPGFEFRFLCLKAVSSHSSPSKLALKPHSFHFCLMHPTINAGPPSATLPQSTCFSHWSQRCINVVQMFLLRCLMHPTMALDVDPLALFPCHFLLSHSHPPPPPFPRSRPPFVSHSSASTRLSPNFGLMFDQRRRRWANVDPKLGGCLVSAIQRHGHIYNSLPYFCSPLALPWMDLHRIDLLMGSPHKSSWLYLLIPRNRYAFTTQVVMCYYNSIWSDTSG